MKKLSDEVIVFIVAILCITVGAMWSTYLKSSEKKAELQEISCCQNFVKEKMRADSLQKVINHWGFTMPY